MKKKLVPTTLKNYANFFEGSGISAEGPNHPVWVGFLLFCYTLLLYSLVAWGFVLNFILIVLCLALFFFTRNPFRFCFFFPLSRHLKVYRYHKKFRFLFIDCYVINGYFFSPHNKIKSVVDAKFHALEVYIDGRCC